MLCRRPAYVEISNQESFQNIAKYDFNVDLHDVLFMWVEMNQ